MGKLKSLKSIMLPILILIIAISCAHYSTARRPESENVINAPIDIVWEKTLEILPTERMTLKEGSAQLKRNPRAQEELKRVEEVKAFFLNDVSRAWSEVRDLKEVDRDLSGTIDLKYEGSKKHEIVVPERKPWGFSLKNDYSTRHIHRGFMLSEGGVNNHQATISYKLRDDISVQLIGFLNFDHDLGKITEGDLDIEITKRFGEHYEATLGHGAYWFPNTDIERAQEIYLILSSSKLLNASIFTAYDFEGGSGWYFEPSFSYDFNLEKINLPAKLSIEGDLGINSKYYRNESGLTYLKFGSGLQIPLGKYAKLRFNLNYQEPLSSDFEGELYGGVGIDFDF